MIPKKLHYIWLGDNPLPESFQICLDSWEKYCPDYEIIKWDNSNVDLDACEYVKLAAEKNQWAFVSDYVRAKALYDHGGIYLDIDVEIKNSLVEFLHHRAFSGFEIVGSPFTALWGTEKGHPWPKKVLDFYHLKTDFDLTTNTVFVSDLLVDNYHIDPNKDEKQELEDGIVIYPSTHFCLDLPRTFAAHHFVGTWHQRDTPNPFKDLVTTHYFLRNIAEMNNGVERIHNVINNNQLLDADQVLNQFPLRMIWNHFLKRIKNRIG